MRSFHLVLAAGIPALAATAGEFNILALNVAGLPPILNGNDVPGDKSDNSRQIGRKFAEYGYDVIHVQEDFNYHAYIYETDNHPYRTPTSGGAGIGSGLNTLSNFEFTNFVRTKWATCSNAEGADCLTPKGFTSMRVRVDEGVYVDFTISTRTPDPKTTMSRLAAPICSSWPITSRSTRPAMRCWCLATPMHGIQGLATISVSSRRRMAWSTRGWS